MNPDRRIQMLREVARAYASADFSARAVPSGDGDDIDELIMELNAVGDRLRDLPQGSPESGGSDHEDPRIEEIAEVLTGLARLDFTQRAHVSSRGDGLDAVAFGLNALGEELRTAAVSATHLGEVLDSVPDGLIVTDPEGSVRRVNRALLELIGTDRQALIGAAVQSVLAESGDAEPPGSVRALVGRSQRRSVRAADGPNVPVAWSGSIVPDEAGRVGAMVFVAHDLRPLLETEANLRDALAERETLLEEVHHRVKNNLQVITSLLRMQADVLADDVAVRLLNQSVDRIGSIALVHEQLYRAPDLATLDLSSYLSELVEHLSTASALPGVRVRTHVTPCRVDASRAISWGLIVNELISNALQHGRGDREKIDVLVRLDTHSDGTVRLSVQDDGVGLPDGFDESAGGSLGLRLIKALCAQLDARFTLTSDGGCRAEVVATLPPSF